MQTSILSKRGAKTAGYEDFLYRSFLKTNVNVFNPRHNPKGIVDLGTAVNTLMDKEVCKRLMQGDALDFSQEYQHYYDFSGTKEIKEALANFLTRQFHTHKPILPSSVVVMNGVTSCLDALAHALCDPGDVIITPSPVYGRIITNNRDVADVCTEFLELSQDESDGESFKLRPKDLDRRITELRSEQRQVRAFILLNPHNPLGQVYSPDLILSLLQVCARHQIHAIVDEIYALSTFSEKVQFCSTLTLDLPDPQRTHVVWGLSKDFCLAGLRIGVVVTESKPVLACLSNSSMFKVVPNILQHTASVLLNDRAWYDEFFLPTSRQRLRAAYERARKRLEGMGAVVREASGGMYMWVCVQHFLTQLTHEEDLALHKELLQAGVFTVPSQVYFCHDPGWMRIVFSVNQEDLDEGLNRLQLVLKRRKRSHA